jgi:hypothetical protein
MRRKLFFAIAAIWVLLAFVFLAVGITPGESRMTADLMMVFLGFPKNLLASEYLTLDVRGPLWQYVLEWSVLFVLSSRAIFAVKV